MNTRNSARIFAAGVIKARLGDGVLITPWVDTSVRQQATSALGKLVAGRFMGDKRDATTFSIQPRLAFPRNHAIPAVGGVCLSHDVHRTHRVNSPHRLLAQTPKPKKSGLWSFANCQIALNDLNEENTNPWIG